MQMLVTVQVRNLQPLIQQSRDLCFELQLDFRKFKSSQRQAAQERTVGTRKSAFLVNQAGNAGGIQDRFLIYQTKVNAHSQTRTVFQIRNTLKKAAPPAKTVVLVTMPSR